jgi:hypothetical protein
MIFSERESIKNQTGKLLVNHMPGQTLSDRAF